jgi:hypothetical protein
LKGFDSLSFRCSSVAIRLHCLRLKYDAEESVAIAHRRIVMVGAKVVAGRKIANGAVIFETMAPFGLKDAVLRTTANAALVAADIPVCRLFKPFNGRSFRGWFHGTAFGASFRGGSLSIVANVTHVLTVAHDF